MIGPNRNSHREDPIVQESVRDAGPDQAVSQPGVPRAGRPVARRAWPGRWTPSPTTARTSYQGFGRLKGRKALDHRRRLGHRPRRGDRPGPRGGRRRPELPAERGEADAKEVVALVEEAGRKALAACPATSRTRRSAIKLVHDASQGPRRARPAWSTSPATSRPRTASPTSPPSSSTRPSRPTSTRCSGSARPPCRTCRPGGSIINTASIQAYSSPRRLAARLCLDQGDDRGLHQGPGQAGGLEGDPGQLRGPRPVLDPAPGQRRPAQPGAPRVRRQDPPGPARPARRAAARSTSSSPRRSRATSPARLTASPAAMICHDLEEVVRGQWSVKQMSSQAVVSQIVDSVLSLLHYRPRRGLVTNR